MSRRQRGFTLLELVVATAIVVVIGVGASMKFSQALANRDRVGERTAKLAELQRTFLFLQRDFEQAVARPARDPLGDVQPALWGLPDGSVELTRTGWSNPLEARPRSRLQRVRWRLEEGRLLREYWDHPDRQVGATPVVTVMAEGVQAFRVSFLDRPAEGEFNWLDSWPPVAAEARQPGQEPAPRAIRVEVEMAPFGEVLRFFRVPANPYARET